MALIFLVEILIFVFGACIGSFLNCVIYRTELQADMPKGSPRRKAVSFLRGKSFCPHCKHTLNWQDLIPVFSFLFLRGKCRYCEAKISIQYPLVEIATGVIFLLIFNFLNFYNFLNDTTNLTNVNFVVLAKILNLGFWFYIASALIIIFVYDLKHYLIPDKVLFPAAGIVFVYHIFENFVPLGNYFFAVLIGSGLFLFIFLISKGRWMGFGDVKLTVLMGFLLGFPNILAGLFLAFFFGAIIGVILMVLNKKGLKSEIPFGPFLIAGTFMTMFWGEQLIKWYLKIFQI